MKSAVLRVLMAFVILTVFGAAQTVSAGDKLPLKKGHYVMQGVRCENASNANIITYHGSGFNSAHVRGTIITMRNNGNIYYIKEKCEGLGGVGGEETYIVQSTVTINSKTSFSISDVKINNEPIDKSVTTYRWCQD